MYSFLTYQQLTTSLELYQVSCGFQIMICLTVWQRVAVWVQTHARGSEWES